MENDSENCRWVMALDVALLCSDGSSYTRNSSPGHYRCISPRRRTPPFVGVHAPWPLELPLPRGQATHGLTVQVRPPSEAAEDASLQDTLPWHFPLVIGTVVRLEQRAAICCPGEACRMERFWRPLGIHAMIHESLLNLFTPCVC
jgi:hypothetical protein